MFKYVISIFLVLFSSMTLAEDFVPGKDYIVLKTNEKIDNKKIVITEFFSYGCPWCYKLEPSLNKWVAEQGNKISYNRVPVVFNKDWEIYAKAYYTAEALTISSQLTPALFKAILTERKPLNTSQAMIDFFVKHGVDAATAQSAFQHSPSIDIELENSKRRMAEYQVSAVPALVINNQYKTDLQMAKTEERLFAIAEYLLNKSASEEKAAG
ncbi:thiol:disulfide interchange protein DsbA (plasmid) [Legionella adelaidensis]|uniref:Thiol:disulfide interchange protein n=1 Tax=Legionella adelaidensis TaxID=45056 RepID=A0A0W0R0W3_9GAMM|nr:thiol:disulfide interchange protein DsbA/DsbL [Legionella adelaidensis]KTC64669.1 thiol:disulfide interchange protein DsbA [Legionella adelaidensis]VEH86137.1 thiol:disulfide interchange protein DsbA [Legionella adelaidensis]